MNQNLNQVLRSRIAQRGDPLLLAGASNALTARLLQETGFEAVYLSGAGIANAYLAAPDVGLLSLDELAAHLAATREAVEVPIVVDADTGFGDPIGVRRTVRILERAGANAIQIEDQVAPKRCGHFAGKSVIPADEMIQKMHAATDARVDEALLVIARTDAAEELGIEAACERAQRYLAAGADVAFVEAPRTLDDLRRIPRRVAGPTLVNMVEGGLTPIVPLAELATFGYAIVLYANTALRAAIAGMRPILAYLREHGDTLDVLDRITTWEDRQRLVRKGLFDALSDRYAAAAGEDA